MAPLITSAQAYLSYPLYVCDFDPQDSTRLVIGGGGGAGRNGVGNKMTVFNTSRADELEEVAEIDLSKDEDCIMSLAVGPRKGNSTLAYAGINSSVQDLQKGKNEHLRVFAIENAGKGKSEVEYTSQCRISEVTRAALFTGKEKDSYQRIVRLSKPFPGHTQLGVIATGLAKHSEVVLFEPLSELPNSRGALQSNTEAADVDVMQIGVGSYLFAYCTEQQVLIKSVSFTMDTEVPACVYTIPGAGASEKSTLPSFRAMRWLTKDFLFVLTNLQGNSGVAVHILRIPTAEGGSCRIAQSHRLPSSIKKSTALAVTNLTPPLSPTDEQGCTQFIIAVAGHDSSISLFKVDLQYAAKSYMPLKIVPFRTLKSVHPLQITSLSFSHFIPPRAPITASTPPQHLKLASTGISNTVVVHTLPLFPVPFSVQSGQSKQPRYVVALPSKSVATGVGVLSSILLLGLLAFSIQAVLKTRVTSPGWSDAVGYIDYMPSRLQEALGIGKPYLFPDGCDALCKQGLDTPARSRLKPYKRTRRRTKQIRNWSPKKVSKLDFVEDGECTSAGWQRKEWEGLSGKEKEGWKRMLIEADQTLLKGMVFGLVGALVGQVVNGN